MLADAIAFGHSAVQLSWAHDERNQVPCPSPLAPAVRDYTIRHAWPFVPPLRGRYGGLCRLSGLFGEGSHGSLCSRWQSLQLRAPAQTRCIASSSRFLASSKKKQVVHNPDAMPISQAAEILRVRSASPCWSWPNANVKRRRRVRKYPGRGRHTSWK